MVDHLPRSKQDVLSRRKAYTGFSVYGKRGTCGLYKRETQWYCVGCHMNCCVSNTTDEAAAIQSLKVILPSASSDVKDGPSTT
jgi:hypothetical protein